jgi:hypothetical protein
MSLAPALLRLVLSRVGWLFATGDERDAEILALRHQVLVLQRQGARPQFTETDRTILAVLSTVFDRTRAGRVGTGALFDERPRTHGGAAPFDQIVSVSSFNASRTRRRGSASTPSS